MEDGRYCVQCENTYKTLKKVKYVIILFYFGLLMICKEEKDRLTLKTFAWDLEGL